MYYYGMKLHVVGHRRNKTLPFPEIIALTYASENDLSIFKRECMPYLQGKTIFGDKIYSDLSYFNETCPTTILTPHKQVKGEPKVIRQREKATRDLFSTAVSKVRQPIESFFNWLNEKNRNSKSIKSKGNQRFVGAYLWKVGYCTTFICKFNLNQFPTADSN